MVNHPLRYHPKKCSYKKKKVK
jgi:hypothetical protein